MVERPLSSRLSAIRLAIFGLFLISGFAGLAYQVVWVRMLTSVFGVTAYAIATVLASFMAGLALGSYVFGRWIDRHPRPLRTYAVLELGIGLYALLVPSMLAFTNQLFRLIPGSSDDAFLLQNLVRIPLAFLVLVLPTTFMGATLPILCKYFIDALDRVGRETGRLYFVNTIGGVLGCAAAGFLLVPGWGLHTTTLIAAGLNVLVGGVAFVLDQQVWRGPAPAAGSEADEAVVRRRASPAQRWILLAFALSGFVALVFEVIWSRVLILIFGSTVYSFSAMLSVFLLGLALGAAAFGRIVDRSRRPWRVLAWIQAAIALILVLETGGINHLPYVFLVLLRAGGLSYATLVLIKFALSFAILFPAAFLFGGTFPVVSKLYTDSLAQTGRRIGTVYAMNTIGAILGSVFGGFVFLPALGLRGSLLAIAGLLVVGACVTFILPFEGTRPLWIPAAAVVVLFAVTVAVLPSWNKAQFALGVYFNPREFIGANGRIELDRAIRDMKNIYYAEGLNDTIMVNQTASERILSINGKSIATSSAKDMLHLKMLGHLPVLLHPGPSRTALNIGMGIGGTISGLAAHPLDRVDVVELESTVVPATRMFADVNDAVLDNPKLRVILNDGRTYLAMTDARYDIISSDPFEPFITGAGNLYSLEYFELGKSRLAPGGVMTQWVPLHELGDREFRSLLATFAHVFPHYTVWFSGESVILIGSESFLSFDPGLIAKRIAEGNAGGWLTRLGVDSPEALSSYLLADQTSLADHLAGVPLNTDAYPLVEYGSARQVYEMTTGFNLDGLQRHALAAEGVLSYFDSTRDGGFDRTRATSLLAAKREGIEGIVDVHAGEVELAIEKLTRAVDASGDPFLTNWLAMTHEQYALIAQAAGDVQGAMSHYEKALRLQPDRPVSLANLGFLDYSLSRYDTALELLERATRLRPEDPILITRLAIVHGALGHAELGEQLLRQAVAIDPRLPTALANLAAVLLQQKNLPEAEKLFRASLAEEETNLGAREMLAQALLYQGKGAEANAECDTLLDLAPQDSVGHLCRGDVRMQGGDVIAAQQEYALAVAQAPRAPEAHYRLARSYAAQGRLPEAAESLQRALDLGGAPYGARASADSLLRVLVEAEPAPAAQPSVAGS